MDASPSSSARDVLIASMTGTKLNVHSKVGSGASERLSY